SLWKELWTNAWRISSGSAGSMPRRSASSSSGGASMGESALLLVLLDELDGVGDLLGLLGILVRDLHSELLFQAHDELDQVEGVGVEVFDERGLWGDLFLVDTELLDDDLLQAFERGAISHEFRLLHPIWKRSLTRHSRGGEPRHRRRSGRERPHHASVPRSGSRRSIAPHIGRSGGSSAPPDRAPGPESGALR